MRIVPSATGVRVERSPYARGLKRSHPSREQEPVEWVRFRQSSVIQLQQLRVVDVYRDRWLIKNPFEA